MEWDTSCKDWERRIVAGESIIPVGALFPKYAEDALNIFKSLRIVDAPNSPTIGECCRPWVIDFARVFFGSYDPETGRRLIRYYLLSVAKKNIKSTLAAAIMLTSLIMNWRKSAEFIILGATVEVANNSFGPAKDMVAADDYYSSILHVQPHYRTITHRDNGGTLKVIAAENEAVSGKKATGLFVDELWLFGKRANAESMLREARGGLASRPEGFEISATTHSDEPPRGVLADKLRRFRDIRNGKIIDKRSLYVGYEYPEYMLKAEAFKDSKTWYIPNPNLGVSVDKEFLQDQYDEAERTGLAAFRIFAAKHLNVEIGVALRSDGWAGAEYWDRGIDPSITFESILERSEVVTVGIDGGGLDDLLGIAIIGRERITKHWLVWTHAFISPEGQERRKANTTLYEQFMADGDLTRVEQLPDDLTAIAEIVKQVKDSGKLSCVGVDAIGIGGIVDALGEVGVCEDDGTLRSIRQGISLTGAIKTVERKVADGTLKHSGQKMMDWCIGNAKVVFTPTAIRLARDEAGAGKIDPFAALLDAAELMMANPEPKNKERQLFFFGHNQGRVPDLRPSRDRAPFA
jgi:phage terminase large subunit-like protein